MVLLPLLYRLIIRKKGQKGCQVYLIRGRARIQNKAVWCECLLSLPSCYNKMLFFFKGYGIMGSLRLLLSCIILFFFFTSVRLSLSLAVTFGYSLFFSFYLNSITSFMLQVNLLCCSGYKIFVFYCGCSLRDFFFSPW